MSNTDHTPLPMEVAANEDEGKHVFRWKEAATLLNGFSVDEMIEWEHGLHPEDGAQYERAEAYAAYIVKAANLAPQLASALEALVAFAEHPEHRCLECGEMRQYYGHNEPNWGILGGFNNRGQIVGHEFLGEESDLSKAADTATKALADWQAEEATDD